MSDYANVKGLWVPQSDKDADDRACAALEKAFLDVAIQTEASSFAICGALATLIARTCGNRCGRDVAMQDTLLEDIINAAKSALVAHGYRTAETEAQQRAADSWKKPTSPRQGD